MLKKLCLGALMLAGIAVFAGERAGLYLKVIGDSSAKITFESESDKVDCEANTYSRNADRKEAMRCCFVEIEDDKPVEVEVEMTSSVSGKGEILVRGFAEDSNDYAFVKITQLVVNDKVVIAPEKKSKHKDIYHHTTVAKKIAVEADQPVKVKATFVHSAKNDSKED